MTDLLERAPVALGNTALRAMFAARKQVFIDLLKWDLPVLAGEYELDQFDDPAAEYLILLDEAGGHRASARLLRTDRPHLLGDLYPFFVRRSGAERPIDTRNHPFLCLDRHQTTAERRSARNQLVTALVEQCLMPWHNGLYRGRRAWLVHADPRLWLAVRTSRSGRARSRQVSCRSPHPHRRSLNRWAQAHGSVRAAHLVSRR